MNALKAEHINKVSLIAFTKNDVGNAFWNCIGWTKRQDLNYYDFTLNEENIKIEFIIQGASNNSLFLFVDEKDEKLATEKLYAYFM